MFSWLPVVLTIVIATGLAAMLKGRVRIPQLHGRSATLAVGVALGILVAPVLVIAALAIAVFATQHA